MNGLIHPDDRLDYARRHHSELLRLVETERVLKPKRAKSPGYRERLLLGISDLLLTTGVRLRLWVLDPDCCPERDMVMVQLAVRSSKRA